MSRRVRPIDADALLELALATLRSELVPALPAERRYQAAMLANALEIVRRSMVGDADSARWELLDEAYDDGEGTLGQLAADIRAGRIDESKVPDLPDRLRKLVLAELSVSNPRHARPEK